MKVDIKRWHTVASWKWNVNDDTCGICRMQFDGCCPDCKMPGDNCPIIWGQCDHAFHLHCIMKWVEAQRVQAQCPMCRREWAFKQETSEPAEPSRAVNERVSTPPPLVPTFSDSEEP